MDCTCYWLYLVLVVFGSGCIWWPDISRFGDLIFPDLVTWYFEWLLNRDGAQPERDHLAIWDGHLSLDVFHLVMWTWWKQWGSKLKTQPGSCQKLSEVVTRCSGHKMYLVVKAHARSTALRKGTTNQLSLDTLQCTKHSAAIEERNHLAVGTLYFGPGKSRGIRRTRGTSVASAANYSRAIWYFVHCTCCPVLVQQQREERSHLAAT